MGRSLVAPLDGSHGFPCRTPRWAVPELPEVEALAQFLRGRAGGHARDRVSIGAISALKTFGRPPTRSSAAR